MFVELRCGVTTVTADEEICVWIITGKLFKDRLHKFGYVRAAILGSFAELQADQITIKTVEAHLRMVAGIAIVKVPSGSFLLSVSIEQRGIKIEEHTVWPPLD